jgi:hypothetical protein
LNIPRLSVDIDLDFAQNLSKEETEEFRLTFKEIFTNRNYRPELLFDDEEIISRIKNHPMALWRTRENG